MNFGASMTAIGDVPIRLTSALFEVKLIILFDFRNYNG